MKNLKHLTLAFALVGTLSMAVAGRADEKKPAKTYPLKTCVVSGEKLGEMGDPYVFTHDGKEVRLCCKSCLKDFKKDPAKYMKKVEAAEKKNKKS
jgi:hypothetical protein